MRTLCAFVAASSLTASTALAESVTVETDEVVACSTFVVSFADLPTTSSAQGHWISVDEADAPASVLTYRFKYLSGSSDGRITFSSRGLMPFKPYEVRLHLDWERTRSYTVVARTPLTVYPNTTCRTPALVRVGLTINQGEPLQFSFQGLKRVEKNWVAIARVEQTSPNFLKSKNLPNAARGDETIDTAGLAPGTYELRLFEDWTGTKEYFVYDRVLFTIQ